MLPWLIFTIAILAWMMAVAGSALRAGHVSSCVHSLTVISSARCIACVVSACATPAPAWLLRASAWPESWCCCNAPRISRIRSSSLPSECFGGHVARCFAQARLLRPAKSQACCLKPSCHCLPVQPSAQSLQERRRWAIHLVLLPVSLQCCKSCTRGGSRQHELQVRSCPLCCAMQAKIVAMRVVAGRTWSHLWM